MSSPASAPISEAQLESALAGSVLAGQDVGKEHDYFFVRAPRYARLLAFLFDTLMVAAGAAATFVWFCVLPGASLARAHTAALLMLYSAVVMLACRALHLYIRPRRSGMLGDLATITQAVVLASAVVLGYLAIEDGVLPMAVVLYAGGLDLALLLGWRAARMKVGEHRMARGKGTRNVLIVGAGRVGQSLAGYIDRHHPAGCVVKGFLDQDRKRAGMRRLGSMDDFATVVRTNFIDEVLVTIPSERELVRNLVSAAQECSVRVRVIPELYEGLGLQAPIDYIGKFPTMELHRDPIPKAGLWAKRALDVAASGVGLVLAAPVMALLALLIKLDSRGPVLYRSQRVGKKGRRFVCYKFRSMVAEADTLKEELRRTQNYRNGPTFKIDSDPRTTQLGRWLRRYSLDELPQLWNILRGEMSLVGPRPHPLDDFAEYDPEHMVRLYVKPGLTGLWQVMARRDPSFERNMQLDLEYIENWTLALDLKILLLTLPAVMHGNGE